MKIIALLIVGMAAYASASSIESGYCEAWKKVCFKSV